MRFNSAAIGLLRVIVLGASLIVSNVARAQSTAIEPCESGAPASKAESKIKSAVSVKETLIDSSIPDDPALEALVNPYAAKVRALNTVIGSVNGDLKTGGVGASSMGYFVADAVLWAASNKSHHDYALALMNAGGLRKLLITSGDIRAADIFELLPFENQLMEVQLTGVQLQELLKRLTSARDAQSGARIEFRWNEQGRPELITGKLIDKAGHESDINPGSTYSILTIDYLLKLRSGNYSLLQDSKKVTPLNMTVRDAVTDYVKSRTAAGQRIESKLDDRFVQVGPSPIKSNSSNE